METHILQLPSSTYFLDFIAPQELLLQRLSQLYEPQRKPFSGVKWSHASQIQGAEEGWCWGCCEARSNSLARGRRRSLELPNYRGPLSYSTPESGVFYVGKTFCLRGGAEKRELKISQFVRSDPDCYTYVENGFKKHHWSQHQGSQQSHTSVFFTRKSATMPGVLARHLPEEATSESFRSGCVIPSSQEELY